MQFIRGHSRYTLDAATARPLWRTVPFFFFFFFFFGRGERGLGGVTVRIVLDGRVRVAVCIDFVQVVQVWLAIIVAKPIHSFTVVGAGTTKSITVIVGCRG